MSEKGRFIGPRVKNQTPLQKRASVQSEWEAIEEFFEYVQTQGYHLERHTDYDVIEIQTLDGMLHDFFGIDKQSLEEERQFLLKDFLEKKTQ